MADQSGLVLGFSQKRETLNLAALADHPIEVLQRRAGGTAVLVGPHLLDLDVLLPAGHPLILADIVESYRWFGQAWVETLRHFDVEARIVMPDEANAQRARLKQPETRVYESLMRRACYGSISSYEVLVDTRKIVGLDMIRRRSGSLLQAGLLLHWETDTLARLLGHTDEEQQLLREGLHERAIGIDSLVGRVIHPEEIIEAFEQVIFTMQA